MIIHLSQMVIFYNSQHHLSTSVTFHQDGNMHSDSERGGERYGNVNFLSFPSIWISFIAEELRLILMQSTIGT